MSSRHKPDHEMQLIHRVLRELEKLPPAGRRRVLMYWLAREDEMPEVAGAAGPQQLDIEEDAAPVMPHIRGAAA